MATAKKTKPAGPADKGLRVLARNPKGLRRAGRHWGPEAQDVALSELDEDQVQALRDEPGLVVVDIDMPAAAA